MTGVQTCALPIYLEDEYYVDGATGLPTTGGFAGLDSWLTDRRTDGLGWNKAFGMGSVYAYVAHPQLDDFLYDASLGTNGLSRLATRRSARAAPVRSRKKSWLPSRSLSKKNVFPKIFPETRRIKHCSRPLRQNFPAIGKNLLKYQVFIDNIQISTYTCT